MTSISRAQLLGFRVRAQQLDREPRDVALDDSGLDDVAVLDIGVQDTGPDGGRWALAIRGVDVSRPRDELSTVWTVRAAPHLYRRTDLPSVAAAVEPFSEADAGKRIYDAAKPLRAAGIPILAALDEVAAAMRSVVTGPMVKGEVSARVADLLGPPYLRFCRPCDATHLYEMPFRLAVLRAGLELRAGTSPPVLEPLPGFRAAATAHRRHQVVRAYLRLLGPATPRNVAGYLDAPVREVKDHWPSDAVEVSVAPAVGGPAGAAADGAADTRWVLADDLKRFDDPAPTSTRLLGPFDLFLQARDRSTLVTDPARAKALWPVLGRPGAVLHGAEIVGGWRPRRSATKLTVQVELWESSSPALRDAVTEQARRLAGHRGIQLSGVDLTD